MASFEKLKVSMRYWLLGRMESDPQYELALDAMDYGLKFHDGTRKDNVTPEFQHQLEIAHYLRTLHRSLRHPVETLAATMLHDVAEDFDVGFEELEARFGAKVTHSVRLLTKKHRGIVVPPEVYFGNIATDPIASVVKGGDRINNLQSMLGVFTTEKQIRYCEEAKAYFIPMLKAARSRFRDQEMVYENIKLMMSSQLALLGAAHEAAA